MNLLTNTDKDILKKGLKLRLIIVATILLAIAFFVGMVTLLPAYFLTREHFDLATSPNASTKVADEEVNKNILELPNEINTKLAFLQLSMEDKGVIDVISKIVTNLPEKVRINSFVFNKNQSTKGKKGIAISLSGTALDRDALVSFGMILRSSNFFSSVDVPVSNLTKEKNLPFSMNIFIEN